MTNFAPIEIPYAYKLLLQELESMSISSRIITKSRLCFETLGTVPEEKVSL